MSRDWTASPALLPPTTAPAWNAAVIAASRGVSWTVFIPTVWSPPSTNMPSRSAVKYGAGSNATASERTSTGTSCTKQVWVGSRTTLHAASTWLRRLSARVRFFLRSLFVVPSALSEYVIGRTRMWTWLSVLRSEASFANSWSVSGW